jgi:FeS assembly SUF system regulator
MLRLSRLADYGVLVMTATARAASDRVSAAGVALATGVPAPTAAKLLGSLTRAGLLVAARGAAGGVTLALPASAISLAAIVEAIDGPIALTECAHGSDECGLSGHCAVRPHWAPVNRAVRDALMQVSLADLAGEPVRIREFA